MKKRGSIQLSFGMIFSIILIVVFIAVAIYIVLKFLGMQETIQIATFKKDFQEEVTAMWNSEGSQEVSYFLPKKISAVCFTDDEYENMFFESEKLSGGDLIEHLALSKLSEDPYCVDVVDGKIDFILSKSDKETLVRIE